MKNMVETTAGPNLVMKAVLAICAFILAIVLLPVGTAHAATTPTIAQRTDWYTSSTDKSTYTTINIVDSYAPTGSEKESWDASAAKDGSVMAYVGADGTTLTLAGNGSGFLKANVDSSGLFREFTSVAAISGLSLLDTNGCTDLSGLFLDDENLVSVEGIEGWDVSSCEDFGAIFHGCKTLTAIDLSKWDVSSATVMSSLVSDCVNLVDLKVPATKAKNLYHIGNAFSGCWSLTSVDISFMNSGKIGIACALFNDCRTLKTVTGYETLITSASDDIAYIFNACHDIEYLDVSQWDVSGAPDLSGIFAYTYSLETINGLENWDVSNAKDIHRLFLHSNISNLDGVCNWDVSNVTRFEEMFGMTNLISLDLSAWNTGSAESMDSMFELCLDLAELKLGPGFTTANVADFGAMFKDCDSIEVLDISTFDTSEASEMSQLFEGMDTLQVITLGENFNFTGDGSVTDCVLPTPDPQYIPSATGNWQAVAGGTVDEPAGTVYAPADVPSNVAETYVMEKVSKPILAANSSWYTSSIDKSTFTTINIIDSYAPAGTELESWDASKALDGSVMAYVSADGKTLTIAGNGYGCIGTTWDCKKAFSGFSSVTVINGIELLDMSDAQYLDDMFYNCQSLVSLNLDGWDVSNVASFRYTFDNCYALTSLGENNLKDWDTSSVAMFFGTFADCESLEAINVSNWDLSACWNIDDMFARCKSLTSIDVSNWDVSYVSNFMCTFDTCVSLESIDVSKWDTSSAESMNGLFNNCKLLKSIDVSGFDTSSCVNISLMFAGCESLASIDVTGFDTSKVEDFQGVFDGCKSLTSIDVSTWDTSAGTEMSFLFDGCIGLTELSLGNFDTSACVDMACMFNGCTSLAKINGLSGWDTSSVEDMTWMFQNCTSIEALDLSTWDTSTCTDLVGTFSKCSGLKVLDISGWDTSSAKYMSNFFSGCTKLQQVTLGEGFSFTGNGSTSCVLPTPSGDYIPGATGKWQAVASGTVDVPKGTVYVPADVPSNVAETYVVFFQRDPILAAGSSWYKADALRNTIVTINVVDSYTADGTEVESWDASAAGDGSVMAYILADGTTLVLAGNGSGCVYANPDSTNAFGNVDNYTSNGNEFTALVTFNGADILDVSKVTDATRMFYYAQKLQALDVSGWDVSNVVTFDSTFAECRAFTTLDVSGWDISSAESLHNIFGQCRALTTLDVSGWDTAGVKDMGSMFEFCRALPSLDVSGFDTSSCTDTSGMFYACTSLGNIDMSGWDTSKVTDMSTMFASCMKFTKLDVTGFDTSNVEDFGFMFQSLLSLGTLDVSGFDTSSAVDMGNMFAQSSALTYLDVTGFDTSSVEDFNGMFNDCESLASVDVTGFDTTSATDFDSMFMNCKKLKVLDLSSFDTSKADDMENFFYNMYRLQQVTLGEKFSFTGDGSANCVLPTPDPAYITGAIGKWQAVGTGTVTKPAGTIYLPEDVPSNVLETYVMPPTTISVDVPIKVTLAAAADGTWCTPTATDNQIINHSLAPVNVVSAEADAADGFTMLANASVASSTTSNVFGGTITAGDGTAQDLTAIDTSAEAWTMAAETDSDDSDLISLQLAGSIGNVEGKYFTSGVKLFDIAYTFELAL